MSKDSLYEQKKKNYSFFNIKKGIRVSDLATYCGFRILGNISDFEIENVETLEYATDKDLSFFGNRKYKTACEHTKAGAVIVTEQDVPILPEKTIALVTSNVMIGYGKALSILYPSEGLSPCISSTALISKSAKIGSNCRINNNVIIDDDVVIGDNVFIGDNTVIEKGCYIGHNGLIRNNVTISNSIIGDNVIINSGARIGESGFGIIPTGKEMVYIKQIGRVIIGDRVRIGANTTIDRGSVEDTEIGDDTIIDNLVQIAHNVKIGKGAILVSQVGIAGSSTIGNGVVLAGQVGVAGHIDIGDGVIVAAKSGIASSIKSGKVVGGIPAVDIGIWKRQAAFLKMSVTKNRKIGE